MQVHNPDQNELKCPTCFQNFATILDHKNHYKSDFHRYNLKRKMVKLSPITQQQFKAKRIESQAQESDGYKCNECGKKFNSVQTLNQHAISKKHNPDKKVMKQENEQAQVKSLESYKKNANVCLFCKKQAENFDLNLRHMQGSHGFFIPQQQFCTNTKGLIEYLQQKIEVGFLCITCENKKAKDFATGEAVRKHMVDKCHLFMKTDEGFQEYQNFYDFSKQFQELLEIQKNVNVPGITYTKVKVYANQKNDENINNDQEEWEDEDDSNDEDGDSQQWEDEENEEEENEENGMKEKKKKKVITYNIMKPTMTANDELLLPNGKILGHRKYRFLYKQSYRNPSWLENKLKAIGWNGEAVANAIISREKMMEIARHDRLLYRTNIRRDKMNLSNGMQNNLLMKFFRCQNSL